MNIRRIIVYALFVALFPALVGLLVGFFVPLANSGLLDSAMESEERWEAILQELQERIALAYRIIGVAVRLVLAVVFARLVLVQRTKPLLHLLGVLLLGWLLWQVVGIFANQFTRAMAAGRADVPIWLWHVALRHLGFTAAEALVGGVAGYFLLRRRRNRG